MDGPGIGRMTTEELDSQIRVAGYVIGPNKVPQSWLNTEKAASCVQVYCR